MIASSAVRRKPGRPPSTPALSVARPDLALEWHPVRNGALQPHEITIGSPRKVWWTCTVGPDHEWLASPFNRNSMGTSCPFCAGKRVSVTNSFATLRPDLAREWDEVRNGISADDLVVGSNKIGWWICAKNPYHQWRAMVKKRAERGDGCPSCRRKRVTQETSLAAELPQLAAEWHPTRNASLTPSEVLSGSSRRVWWVCSKDPSHEWRTAIAERCRGHRTGCPFCTGRRTDAAHSLAATHPQLAAQWHPDRNGELTPQTISSGSEKIVWWRCPVAIDHEWQVDPASRKRTPACPFCLGRRASSTSSLASKVPQIADQWHSIKNGEVTARDVVPQSQKKAWWRCRAGHEWEAVIRNRAVLGNGCPYCSGFYASPDHSVQARHPEVAKYWHPTKNGLLTPADVPPAAKRAVWWKCPAGPDHEWHGAVYTATGAGQRAGCPYCAGRRLSVTNRLSTTYPRIASEWHLTRNGSVTPHDVVFGSTKNVWWQCAANPLHVWKTIVVARTREGNGTNCPYCYLTPRSLQELLVAFELLEFVRFNVDDHKIRIKESDGNTVLLDVDIVVRSRKIVMEFDGSYWHRHKVEQDSKKSYLLRKNGWRVIRIREAPLHKLHHDDVEVPSMIARPKLVANRVLQKFAEVSGVHIDLADYLRADRLQAEERARRHALRLAAKKQK